MAENIVSPGDRVFVAGASGEPVAASAGIFATPNLDIVTSFVPGINRLTPEMVGEGTRITGLFMSPVLAPLQRARQYRHLPISYAGMVKHLKEGPGFDVCVVHVSPPDAAGLSSMGVSADFVPLILPKANRVVAVVNAQVKRLKNSPTIRLSDCVQVVETDAPIARYAGGSIDPVSQGIATSVANLIEDGAVIQVGLGKVPSALTGCLTDRRRLRFHSGMISDGIMDLDRAGALDLDWQHATASILGSETLYDWAAETSLVHIRSLGYTHDLKVLAGIERMTAINSGLEIDLLGQCNLEFANHRAISGGGGSTDFARAARMSPGGISIVALPATFGGGKNGEAKGSRIRARLDDSVMTTVPRSDVDIVVTEEGVADLRGLSVFERAEALIEVAAPEFRADLTDAWAETVRRM